MVEKKHLYFKTTAKIALIVLLLSIIGQLIAVLQTRYVLSGPVIPEYAIWDINKQYIYHTIIAAGAGILALVLYFFEKYFFIIICVAMVLIANRFITL